MEEVKELQGETAPVGEVGEPGVIEEAEIESVGDAEEVITEVEEEVK